MLNESKTPDPFELSVLAEMLQQASVPLQSDQTSAWATQATSLIEAAAKQHVVDWEEIASKLLMSYDGFRKRFKRLTGTSPADFHAARLMDVAGQLMVRENLSGKEVADRLGFGSEYYFSRRFKSVTGSTPTEFRRKLMEDLVTPEGIADGTQSIHFNYVPAPEIVPNKTSF